MMRRIAVPLAIILGTITFHAPPSAAGGSWLEVVGGERVRLDGWDLPYAAVGGTVTMRGDFSDGQLAPVSAGPWYLYLQMESGDDAPLSEPLGALDIVPLGTRSYTASASFEVPGLPSGHYSVLVCTLGCTKIGVGDLLGGSVFVGATSGEARLGARLQILRWMQDEDERALRTLDSKVSRLEEDLAQAEGSLASESARVALLEGQARAMATSNERTRERVAEAERALARSRLIAWSLGAVVLLLGIASAWHLARRRRNVIPDTPAELIGEASRSRGIEVERADRARAAPGR